jgi:ligand-binding sensor domain-containing protein
LITGRPDNGLPQNSVRDILQTRDGYLWLTTFDGLVRSEAALSK